MWWSGTATYQVEEGAIVGKTKPGSPNSFLCTDKLYGDFEMTFDVKVHDRLNSGVQIRSQTKGGPTGRVNGPQVEIEASGAKGAEAGYIYGGAFGGAHSRRPRVREWLGGCSLLKTFRAERFRQEFGEGGDPDEGALFVAEEDREMRCEFVEDLAAGPAGAASTREADGEGREVAVPGRDGLEDGGAFGADRQTVGSVLDVATGENLARGGEEGRADLELRVGGVGRLAGGRGMLEQFFVRHG